ncbi:radical SAM/SPASM domain-containing protein, partial [bacterium]
LFIEPLYYCNLRCPLCLRHQQEFAGNKGKIDLGLVDRIFEELGPYLFQCSIFGNGEPTLDWTRTAAVIAAARRHRIFTTVSTNATLITEAMAERIVSSGLDYLICAIDGVSQEAYESYRVGGKVEDALNGMRRVLAAKRRQGSRLVVEWQYLVHKHNEHELDEARRLAKEMGVAVRFAPIQGMGEDSGKQEQWAASDPKYREGVLTHGVPMKKHHCYWLWRSVQINAAGTMARCASSAGETPVGSLHSQSIADLYNGTTSQSQRRIFNPAPMPDEEEVPGPCNTCTIYVRCHTPRERSATKKAVTLEVMPA